MVFGWDTFGLLLRGPLLDSWPQPRACNVGVRSLRGSVLRAEKFCQELPASEQRGACEAASRRIANGQRAAAATLAEVPTSWTAAHAHANSFSSTSCCRLCCQGAAGTVEVVSAGLGRVVPRLRRAVEAAQLSQTAPSGRRKRERLLEPFRAFPLG